MWVNALHVVVKQAIGPTVIVPRRPFQLIGGQSSQAKSVSEPAILAIKFGNSSCGVDPRGRPKMSTQQVMSPKKEIENQKPYNVGCKAESETISPTQEWTGRPQSRKRNNKPYRGRPQSEIENQKLPQSRKRNNKPYRGRPRKLKTKSPTDR